MTIISWIIEKAQHSLDFFDTLRGCLTRRQPQKTMSVSYTIAAVIMAIL